MRGGGFGSLRSSASATGGLQLCSSVLTGFFRQADLRVPAKQAVTIRLDADVLSWFKDQGAGYQTRINQLLRQYMQAQQRQR